MPILHEDAHCRISFYPEHYLIEHAPLAPANGRVVRQAFDRVLLLARSLAPRLWLADNRCLPHLSADTTDWLAHDYLPRLARLPIEASAVLLPTTDVPRRIYETALEAATPCIVWQERIFDNRSAAWQWLVRTAHTHDAYWHKPLRFSGQEGHAVGANGAYWCERPF